LQVFPSAGSVWCFIYTLYSASRFLLYSLSWFLQVFPSAGSVWCFIYTLYSAGLCCYIFFRGFCRYLHLLEVCAVSFTHYIPQIFVVIFSSVVFAGISICRNVLMFYLHNIFSASFLVYSFSWIAGISICRKPLMFLFSQYPNVISLIFCSFYFYYIFYLISWFSSQDYPSAGSVGRFFYILVVLHSCRSYYFISLLTSVVFAGISICRKCMMIHSSHYSQYYYIVFLQEYPSAGSDWRFRRYYVLNVISWFFSQEYSSAGIIGRFFSSSVWSVACSSLLIGSL